MDSLSLKRRDEPSLFFFQPCLQDWPHLTIELSVTPYWGFLNSAQRTDGPTMAQRRGWRAAGWPWEWTVACRSRKQLCSQEKGLYNCLWKKMPRDRLKWEMKESWPWPQHHIAAEWAVVLSYIPLGNAMVKHFQGRRYIWLENFELLLCPTPVFSQANISGKILGISLFFATWAYQRPGIVKSFVIFSAECVSHPQEHQALTASSFPLTFMSTTVLWATWHGGGKMSTGYIPLQPTNISTCILDVRTMNKPKSPPGMMPQHWPQVKGSIMSSVCHL